MARPGSTNGLSRNCKPAHLREERTNKQKSEIRNPKSETNSNRQKAKLPTEEGRRFGFRLFGFGICFGFRISNFGFGLKGRSHGQDGFSVSRPGRSKCRHGPATRRNAARRSPPV